MAPPPHTAITTSVREYRPLIEKVVSEVWPTLEGGADWIEIQVLVESTGDPRAKSGAGAIGLMQLMPATATELGVKNPWDPEENVRGGVTYMRSRFARLTDVPDDFNRLLWSFASYNGGLGYVLQALKLSRIDIPDDWWKWSPGKFWLMNRKCSVSYRYPDYRQMWGYVDKILKYHARIGR